MYSAFVKVKTPIDLKVLVYVVPTLCCSCKLQTFPKCLYIDTGWTKILPSVWEEKMCKWRNPAFVFKTIGKLSHYFSPSWLYGSAFLCY
jgi:hypothetical protein